MTRDECHRGAGTSIDLALTATAICASDWRVMAAHNADKPWPRMGNSIDMGAGII